MHGQDELTYKANLQAVRLAAELADNACVFPSAPGADRAAVPRAVAEGLVQARYLVITPVAEGLVQAAPRLALLTTMALLSYFCYTTQYLLWRYLLWLYSLCRRRSASAAPTT